MIAPTEFAKVTSWLSSCKRPLLLTHRRPDGDALGSVAALSAILRECFASQPVAALFEPFPTRYAMLQPLADWKGWTDFADEAHKCDAVIILDTCSNSQLEPVAAFLTNSPRTLVIDHHATRDEIGTRPGDLRLIDETAAANALILAEWAHHEQIPTRPEVATALFVGIATDCGWFRFSNADSRTLQVASQLADRGVKLDELYAALYQQEPFAKMKLIGLLLCSLELHADGRLATMFLRPADFAKSGADRSMTEDLVNEAGRIGSVECTLLFSDEGTGEIRVNLRSRKFVDVAAIAKSYGGGGHARAAGCRLRGNWDETVPGFIDLVSQMVRKHEADPSPKR